MAVLLPHMHRLLLLWCPVVVVWLVSLPNVLLWARDFRIVLSLSDAGYPYVGDMDGFGGADYYCMSPNGVDDRAARALLLDNPSLPALTEHDMQMPHRFYNVHGALLFPAATSFADLLDGNNVPMPQAEFFDREGKKAKHRIWSGANGKADQCVRHNEAWRFYGNRETGTAGDPNTPSKWWNAGSDSCKSYHQLYCVTPIPGARGDPHFVGFDGCKFDFDGLSGHVFAIYSDAAFQLNALFHRLAFQNTEGNWMTRLGVRTKSFGLILDPEVGLFLAEENTLLRSSGSLALNETKIELQFDADDQLVKHMTLRTDSITMRAEVKRFHPSSKEYFINIDFEIHERPYKPHGVLGQTARFLSNGSGNGIGNGNVNGTDMAAEKEQALACPDPPVEGATEDYLVADGILGTQFAFSQFAREIPPERLHPLHHRTTGGNAVTHTFVAIGRESIPTRSRKMLVKESN